METCYKVLYPSGIQLKGEELDCSYNIENKALSCLAQAALMGISGGLAYLALRHQEALTSAAIASTASLLDNIDSFLGQGINDCREEEEQTKTFLGQLKAKGALRATSLVGSWLAVYHLKNSFLLSFVAGAALLPVAKDVHFVVTHQEWFTEPVWETL